jgi:hypothetical protein
MLQKHHDKNKLHAIYHTKVSCQFAPLLACFEVAMITMHSTNRKTKVCGICQFRVQALVCVILAAERGVEIISAVKVVMTAICAELEIGERV